MIRKTLYIIALSAYIVLGQDAGLNGLSFLKIGPSARSIGTSDIGLLNSDPSSAFYNPAAVNLQESAAIMFTHQIWIQDLTSEILNANFKFLGLPFAIGVNTTKISGFEVRTLPTESPEATFNVNYLWKFIHRFLTFAKPRIWIHNKIFIRKFTLR